MRVPQLFVASGATQLRPRPQALPVHARLPAELPGRGLDLRRLSRPDEARRARSASSSRTTRTARSCWPGSAGDRPLEGEGRRCGEGTTQTATDVQTQLERLKTSGANTLALFATPKFAIAGLRIREPARLATARPMPLERLELRADSRAPNEGVRSRSTYPQGPDATPQWRADAADEALPHGHGEIRKGREREGRSTTSTGWRSRTRPSGC